jgi:FtsP/CotA-like multicopper oxidase with cupredoxin domain
MMKPIKDASPIGRRKFLKVIGLSASGLGLAACTTRPTLVNPQTQVPPGSLSPTATTQPTPTPTPNVMAMATPAPTQQGGADDMDAMHEKGVKIFLDNAGKDDSFWPKPLDYKTEGGYKVFELTCKEVQWDTGGGAKVHAMTYNGIVPGPVIRIVEGDNVRINVHNEMRQSTAVHFHGVLLPNKMDGVPFITQAPIKPGASFTYEFTAKNPGSHMYHSHHNSTEQVTGGLLAPFIIEPADKSKEPVYDTEYILVLNDTGIGLTINGKGFPYTQPIIARKGEKVRIRYMNEGLLIHPMHLHGLEQSVFAKDGWTLPQPYTCDTLNIAPGERYDVLVNCHTPGAWAFHCHILAHAESQTGMFGMVTAVVVQE